MSRVIALLALIAANVAPAHADTHRADANRACSTRDDLLNRLSQSYAEAPVALGVASNGGVLEVLSTGSGSSWTIIITMPDGQSCLFASGESWQTLPDPAGRSGTAATPPA